MDSTETPLVERSIDLDAGTDDVIEALVDPELLSSWLGEWTPDDHGGATVVTDDGVERSVRDITVDDVGVRWRWSPVAHPDIVTEVVIGVAPLGDRCRVTVVECATTGAVASPGTAVPVPWLPCLAALGAVLALGSLVAA